MDESKCVLPDILEMGFFRDETLRFRPCDAADEIDVLYIESAFIVVSDFLETIRNDTLTRSHSRSQRDSSMFYRMNGAMQFLIVSIWRENSGELSVQSQE